MKVKHKGILIFLVVVGLLLVTTTSVFAQTVTFTQHFHNATQSFPTTNPCSGAAGTVTLTYNGVMHVTMDSSTGTGHFTATSTGDFMFVPVDLTQPTYTGHFTMWDGANGNFTNFEASDTFNLHGTGSDGSVLAFHMDDHITVINTSEVVVSFDHMHCG